LWWGRHVKLDRQPDSDRVNMFCCGLTIHIESDRRDIHPDSLLNRCVLLTRVGNDDGATGPQWFAIIDALSTSDWFCEEISVYFDRGLMLWTLHRCRIYQRRWFWDPTNQIRDWTSNNLREFLGCRPRNGRDQNRQEELSGSQKL
jgi:hypothetical protein